MQKKRRPDSTKSSVKLSNPKARLPTNAAETVPIDSKAVTTIFFGFLLLVARVKKLLAAHPGRPSTAGVDL